MRSSIPKWLLFVSCVVPGLVQAQATPSPLDTSGWSPPPLVEAPDAPRASSLQGPATPPPPGYVQPPPGTATIISGGSTYGTGTSSYGLGSGYSGLTSPSLMPNNVPPGPSPYGLGTAGEVPKPGPEIGLMVTESLFGVLTSAGTALIPYYLLLKPLAAGGGGVDSGLVNLIFIMTFSAVPLAVSQTEVSLANGSRYYYSDGWPAALGGLVAEAAVVGAYYLLRPATQDGGESVLLIGTVAFVPIATMAAINLTKQPRSKMGYGGMGNGLIGYSPEGGIHVGLPLPMPLFSQSRGFTPTGVGFNLFSGRW